VYVSTRAMEIEGPEIEGLGSAMSGGKRVLRESLLCPPPRGTRRPLLSWLVPKKRKPGEGPTALPGRQATPGNTGKLRPNTHQWPRRRRALAARPLGC